MAAQFYSLLVICLFTAFTISLAAPNNGTSDDLATADNSTVSSNGTDDKDLRGNEQNKERKLTKCIKAFCHRLGKCTEVDGVGAVCSCPDTRTYLDKDGKTCRIKRCNSNKASRSFSCGSGAKCSNKYDLKLSLPMPQCYCPTSWLSSIKYVLDPSTQSCKRDRRFQTCDWPKLANCDQKCKTVYNARTQGTSPQCTCRTGYSYDNSQKKCIVTDPCKADNSNGGCAQQCDFNGRTLAVTCSCHSTDYTLGADGKSCDIKNCRNGNSGCGQNCIPLSGNNYYCTCNRGYHLNPDSKTCYDYDECAGHHGCDQECVPDGKGYFFCDCYPGYKLSDNGYSCRVEEKCVNHGCSQHCNPTTGACFCDKTHTLAADGRTCVDIDECKLGTDDCKEKCVNTEGGYSCECFDNRARLSNDLKTCILDTCVELDDIENGHTKCVHGQMGTTMQVGDYCTFTCNKGTRLVGSNFVQCTKTGYDVTPPHCANINECSTPNRCLENELCSDTIGSFVCVCRTGYQRINGICTDMTGPQVIRCPKDKILQLPDDAATITYGWSKPLVRDPTDPKVSTLSGPSSEQKSFGIGSETITYLFSDDAQNKAICSFKVKVVDVTAPTFSNCPNGTVFARGPGVYDISDFAKVTATDNSGKVTLTHDEPPKFLNPGKRTVNYLAKDNSGNHATCTFYVNIVVNECPELSPPENGYHGCDDWHIGTYCEPKCKTGFAFYDLLPSNKYHCGDDGTWTPTGALPKCYPTVQPTEATLVYVSKYRGTCPKDDPAVLKSVTDMAQSTFDLNKDTFCFAGSTCSIPDGPTVECKGDSFTISLKTDEDYSKVPEHGAMIVEFKKKVKAVTDKNPTQTFMGLFIPPSTILRPLADLNGLPSTPIFSMKCPATSKNIGNNCVTCPPGASC